MRLAAPFVLTLALLACLTGPAQAEDIRASYDVRLLGLPVGKMRFAAREEAGAYAVTGVFDTSGIGRIVEAGFRLSAQGRDRQGRLTPQAYDERIDTGSRQSTASLRYKGGVPRITGGSVAAEVAQDPGALDPATQGGTVDPMTALWGVLRDRPLQGLCSYDVTIFDGQRRARLAMTGRRDGAGQVICTGAYTRLAGFSASEMKRQSIYPFAVTYTPTGTLMRAQALTVKSAYGTAEMTRD
ncbi:DUF3108 domain-containing protein [Roseovarius sp. S1116L3]|uniref:DUF3108 domain-containing protein n=1 Tax=Roseovarius roseus TaxID=3342636 RepID=UPI003727C99C